MSQNYTRPQIIYLKFVIIHGRDQFNIIFNVANLSETHTFDKPTYLPCTLTQNIQNTDKAISLLKHCAKKQ
jgi:hypothetical protein